MNTKNQNTALGQKCNKTTSDDLQVTLPLDNPSPVNFQIQLQGAGLPVTDPSTWNGQIDTVGITVVPEFGPIAPIIFIIYFMIALFLIKKFGINFLQFGKQTGI